MRIRLVGILAFSLAIATYAYARQRVPTKLPSFVGRCYIIRMFDWHHISGPDLPEIRLTPMRVVFDSGPARPWAPDGRTLTIVDEASVFGPPTFVNRYTHGAWSVDTAGMVLQMRGADRGVKLQAVGRIPGVISVVPEAPAQAWLQSNGETSRASALFNLTSCKFRGSD